MNEATRPVGLRTADGLALEAEYAAAAAGSALRAAAVLCHPHPQYGGSMRSIVIGALFGALPAAGVACLRFNFRGVERSEGDHGGGRSESLDVDAALDAIAGLLDPGPTLVPVVLAGWSFGADVALSVADPRVSGWVAIAPPLRFADTGTTAADARPKHLVLAEHDEFRSPADVRDAVAGWNATTVEVVAGASHFFVGRTDRVVAATQSFVDRL